MTRRAPRGPLRSTRVEMARSLAAIAIVLAVSAGILATLDRMPALITGRAHGVVSVATVNEASRRIRARIVLPAYFPQALAWPPSQILVSAGRPPAAALLIAGQEGGAPRLIVAQTGAAGEVPSSLLPGTPLDGGSPTKVGEATGRLRRIIGSDGEVWWEIAWTYRDRSVVMRSRGELQQLVEMARSARETP